MSARTFKSTYVARESNRPVPGPLLAELSIGTRFSVFYILLPYATMSFIIDTAYAGQYTSEPPQIIPEINPHDASSRGYYDMHSFPPVSHDYAYSSHSHYGGSPGEQQWQWSRREYNTIQPDTYLTSNDTSANSYDAFSSNAWSSNMFATSYSTWYSRPYNTYHSPSIYPTSTYSYHRMRSSVPMWGSWRAYYPSSYTSSSVYPTSTYSYNTIMYFVPTWNSKAYSRNNDPSHSVYPTPAYWHQSMRSSVSTSRPYSHSRDHSHSVYPTQTYTYHTMWSSVPMRSSSKAYNRNNDHSHSMYPSTPRLTRSSGPTRKYGYGHAKTMPKLKGNLTKFVSLGVNYHF